MSCFVLFFVPCAFGIVSQESLPNPKLQRFTSISSPNGFIVLALVLAFSLGSLWS